MIERIDWKLAGMSQIVPAGSHVQVRPKILVCHSEHKGMRISEIQVSIVAVIPTGNVETIGNLIHARTHQKIGWEENNQIMELGVNAEIRRYMKVVRREPPMYGRGISVWSKEVSIHKQGGYKTWIMDTPATDTQFIGADVHRRLKAVMK